ncbi:hypothetical protein D3C84_984250 [compost metagenome]
MPSCSRSTWSIGRALPDMEITAAASTLGAARLAIKAPSLWPSRINWLKRGSVLSLRPQASVSAT